MQGLQQVMRDSLFGWLFSFLLCLGLFAGRILLPDAMIMRSRMQAISQDA